MLTLSVACLVNFPLTFRGEILLRSLGYVFDIYFGSKVGDQDKSWATRICCVTCVRIPTGWVNCSRKMAFAFPMVWGELRDHASGCFFCFSNIRRITYKYRHKVYHPALPSIMRPVPHSKELPVPKPPTFSNDNSDSDENRGQQVADNVDIDPTSEASCFSSEIP